MRDKGALFALIRIVRVLSSTHRLRNEGEVFLCRFEGVYEMLYLCGISGWLRDIQSNNSEIVFVPRFIMEGWMGSTVNDFLYDEMWQRRCIQAIVDLIEV